MQESLFVQDPVTEVILEPITQDNWHAALALRVRPDQLDFVADFQPIAALVLAKAYVRVAGKTWVPYAILAGGTEAATAAMVGLLVLAYEPGSSDDYWLFHFFIDRRWQGRGYGAAAVRAFIALVRREHLACCVLHLSVNPENLPAQRLYARAGFVPTGEERWGELVYQLRLDDSA